MLQSRIENLLYAKKRLPLSFEPVPVLRPPIFTVQLHAK